MKKKVLAGLVGTMLVTSVGFAAPVTELEKGQTLAGFNYSKFDVSWSPEWGASFSDASATGFYIEHAASDKLTFGIERNNADYDYTEAVDDYGTHELTLTDIYANYKMNKNVAFVLGSRAYDVTTKWNESGWSGESTMADESKIFFGVKANTQLADKVNGYAALINSSVETELKIGATYAITENTSFDLNYTTHTITFTEDDGTEYDLKLKGLGFGLSYKF